MTGLGESKPAQGSKNKRRFGGGGAGGEQSKDDENFGSETLAE